MTPDGRIKKMADLKNCLANCIKTMFFCLIMTQSPYMTGVIRRKRSHKASSCVLDARYGLCTSHSKHF